MGLFDGFDGNSDTGSTAQMAKWLGAPVLLVVDCWAMGRSIAALVKGFTVRAHLTRRRMVRPRRVVLGFHSCVGDGKRLVSYARADRLVRQAYPPESFNTARNSGLVRVVFRGQRASEAT